jgi:hypothetical protein
VRNETYITKEDSKRCVTYFLSKNLNERDLFVDQGAGERKHEKMWGYLKTKSDEGGRSSVSWNKDC